MSHLSDTRHPALTSVLSIERAVDVARICSVFRLFCVFCLLCYKVAGGHGLTRSVYTITGDVVGDMTLTVDQTVTGVWVTMTPQQEDVCGCVCVAVCLSAPRAFVSMHVFVRGVSVCSRAHVCVCVCVSLSVSVSVRVFARARVCVCARARVCVYARARACVCQSRECMVKQKINML